jgi:hypothetical protein
MVNTTCPTTELTASQGVRLRIARNDLERARRLDLAAAPPHELVLLIGALTSSLFNVLQVVDDVTAGAEQ